MGLVFWALLVFALAHKAVEKIALRIHARKLSLTEAPQIAHFIKELCRRASTPIPQVWIISSQVPNIGTMGFFKKDAHLIITSEVLNLSREEQIALLARGITVIAKNDTPTATWLCQFLNLIEKGIQLGKRGSKKDSLQTFLLQTILYPVSIFPAYILGRTTDAFELDKFSLNISREPLALSECYRKTESKLRTEPFHLPLNTHHLFLAEPNSHEMLPLILFKRRSLMPQIKALNALGLH